MVLAGRTPLVLPEGLDGARPGERARDSIGFSALVTEQRPPT